MDVADAALIAVAAVAGGAVNAIAGGGSLITFPALVAAGLPPIAASATNTIALCPGYLGATLAQRAQLAGQRRRAWPVIVAGIAGGAVGARLLLATGEATFELVVPFLLVLASALLGFQDAIKKRLPHSKIAEAWAALPVALAAVYGGYFGAGLSVIVLAALAIVVDDTLVRINALKQAVALAVNVSAAIVFCVLGAKVVDWTAAAIMAVGALAGGAIGGALSARVSAKLLRWTVVVVGLVVAAIYFTKLAGSMAGVTT